MTYYNYRWLIALTLSGVIVALGFVYFIQPGQKRLAELRVQALRLTSQLAAIKTFNTASSDSLVPPSTQADRVAMLSWFAHQQGLFIQSMDYLAAQQSYAADTELIRLNLQGSWPALASFLFALNRQPSMPIRDFAFTLLDQQALRLSVELYLLKNQWPLPPLQKNIVPKQTLFCPGLQGLASNSSADTFIQTASVTLDRIKMLGYLQQGARRVALVLLPNNEVVSVEQGSLLGREQGLVTLVSTDHLLITLPDKKQQEIRR